MSDENLVKLFLGLNAQSIEASIRISHPNPDYYKRRDVVWEELKTRIKPAQPPDPAEQGEAGNFGSSV